MQSGGEEEQDEEAHNPLPPPMEIIKDPSAQDDKVTHKIQSKKKKKTVPIYCSHTLIRHVNAEMTLNLSQ